MTTPGAGRSSIGVRVRPNANNFIRDLKAQLAEKKATYWVDVKANMAPASKDVKAWAAGDLKTFDPQIPVGANMLQATRDLNKWKNLQRENKTNIPIGVDMTPAQRELTAWRQAAKRDLEIPVKLNVRDLDAALERAAKRKVKAQVEVEGDTAPLERKLNGLFLPGGKFKEIKIDADTSAAERKVAEVKKKAEEPVKSQLELDLEAAQNRLRRLRIEEASRKLGIPVSIDADPKKADLQLKLLRARAAANDLDINIKIKKGAIDRLKGGLDSIQKGFGSLTVLRSLDLGPITLGKPTGLIGTLATLTTLAGLIPGAVTGIAALSDGFIRLAGAASIVPGAIGGIAASLSTFLIASSGVGDVVSAMFDVWNEGASKQASTAKSVMSAQNGYRNALVDEARAQKDLSQARQDALNDLRNLNNELRGGVLNEAQAILDAQKARDRYAQGLMSGFDSETDRVQGLLDIATADQRVTDVRERNLQLQQKANKANQDGVEGSDRVTQALEQQVRAQQAVAQSLESIAASSKSSAMTKFNELLAQLSPNAQQFINTLMGMRGPLTDFRNELQDTLFQGLGPALENGFNSLLPVVGPGMKAIAAAMNQNILQVFDTLKSPDGQSIIGRILGGTAEAQKALTGLIDPLVRGFGTLMAAGAEHLPQVVGLFTQLADRFADFIDEADKNGTLDKFMNEGIDALGDLAETGINLVKIANDFSDAFRKGFGKDIFETIKDITAKWHEFLSSSEGQEKLLGFINEAKDLWADWKPILQDLPDILKSVGDGAQTLIDGITPFLNLFTSVMREAPGLVKTFVEVWLGSKLITGFLSPVAGLLGGIIKGFKFLSGVTPPAWLANLPGAPGTNTPPGPGVSTGNKPGQTPKKGPGTPVAGFGGPLLIATTLIPWAAEGAQDFPLLHPTRVRNRKTLLDWVNAGADDADKKKRAEWVAANYPDEHALDRDPLDPGIPQAGQYFAGGFTNWDKTVGKKAVLHGKEYIQPADTTAFYGRSVMEAIHEKRIPKGMFAPFLRGVKGIGRGKRSFQGGGHYDPDTGQWVEDDGPTPTNAAGPNPAAPSLPGIIQHGLQGASSVTGNIDLNSPSGPAPGPAPGVDASGNPTYGIDTSGGQATPDLNASNSIDIFGFKIPFGDQNTPEAQNRGWGPNGSPIGLGGIAPGSQLPTTGSGPGGKLGPGDPGFDIRSYGIGPGPPGSGPADWQKFVGTTLGNAGASIITSLATGVLDFFGLGGILQSDYFKAGTGLLNHFLNPEKGVTGPNASTDAAGNLLNTYANMPSNPDYPGYANLPQVFDPATGTALTQLPPGTGVGPTGPVAYNTKDPKLSTLSYLVGVANQAGLRVGAGSSDPNVSAAVGAGVHSADGKLHTVNQALDIGNGPDDVSFAQWWVSDPQRVAATKELILHVPGWDDNFNIKNGKFIRDYGGPGSVYDADTLAGHDDHMHLAVGSIPNMVNLTDGGGMAPGAPMPDFSSYAPPAASNTGDPGLDALNDALALTPSFTPGLAPTPSPGGGSSPGKPGWWKRGGSPYGYHPTPSKSQQMGIKAAAASASPGGGTSVPLMLGGQNITNWSAYKGQLKQLAYRMYLQAGMPPAEWPAFDRLIQKESSWNPEAKNPISTAYGLGQFLDTTDAQYGPRTSNPFIQLPRIFAYLRDRYHGSPGEALRFHNANNWYDHGGWLMPGQTITHNDTGKPELIVPHDKLASFATGGFMPESWGLPGMDQPNPAPPPSIWTDLGGNDRRAGIPWLITRPGTDPFLGNAGTQTGPISGGVRGNWPTESGNQFWNDYLGHMYPGPGIEMDHAVPSFYSGGFNAALPVIPKPPPRPPDARKMVPPKIPPPPPPPVVTVPSKPAVPPIIPSAPPPPPAGAAGPAAPGPRSSNAVAFGPAPAQGGAGSTDPGMHLHPAIQKGIQSGAAVAGNLASAAISAGTMGLGGGGGLGGFVSGLIAQGGKIATNIANIGASFLVGNITGGTTANAYGVTQRGTNPTGGTKVIDASNNHNGDIYTNDLDEYFRRTQRRDDQRAQASLGHWAR